MAPGKANCWEEKHCGREPGGARAAELGPCPAATDSTCDGINGGLNAGRLCWAVAGTLCSDQVDGTFEEKIQPCQGCSFFRRVKYEEGCDLQLLKPGLGASDPAELHRLLNSVVALVETCRDIFACLAEGPLLERIARHALDVTGASSAAAYLFRERDDELVLAAHAGPLGRPERVGLDEACPAAEAARTRRPAAASAVVEPLGAASVVAAPVGGHDRLAGVLEVVKAGRLTLDGQWFLREFSLIAALGIGNARLVEDLRQLRRFDKAKSRFVAVLMHHIGSPLATIACSLQALSQLGEKLSPGDRAKLIQVSLERIGSVQALSRRLLDLAAIRSGRSLGDVRPVCLADPLCQEIDGRAARAQELGVDLVMTTDGGTDPVMADRDGLRVIFANLLDNAIKYSTGPVRRVSAAVATRRGHVQVCIRDTGIGIPPEDQGRVFEEFHRASNAATHASGHGLGLAAVKSLVDRYGGRIELESEVGVGTAFTISFPIVPGPRPRPLPATGTRPPSP